MQMDEHASADTDRDRFVLQALASLREAAEKLGDAAAASEHPSLGVASALSHVTAAREALRSRQADGRRRASGQDAA